MTTPEREMDKLELTFTRERETKRAVVFNEQLGDQAYSERAVAVGYVYIQKEALQLIGNPDKVKITVEPA